MISLFSLLLQASLSSEADEECGVGDEEGEGIPHRYIHTAAGTSKLLLKPLQTLKSFFQLCSSKSPRTLPVAQQTKQPSGALGATWFLGGNELVLQGVIVTT